eukprot:TRINITY_DN28174_c0_g2_i1.p1 TRINITY_DN28174_c0_g2~~TRINITY_DN28174_c0_g2_i1.p1  ORF type:complete len:259 (-),score=25.90 TRINITY_DN28174_c0_g2_i1:510-1286(-)
MAMQAVGLRIRHTFLDVAHGNTQEGRALPRSCSCPPGFAPFMATEVGQGPGHADEEYCQQLMQNSSAIALAKFATAAKHDGKTSLRLSPLDAVPVAMPDRAVHLPGTARGNDHQHHDNAQDDELPFRQAATLPPGTKTLMLCNLPCGMILEDVRAMLGRLGYNGTFNYIKLPVKVAKGNLGYAFVDFGSAGHAHNFASDFTNYRFEGRRSVKVPFVRAAATQEHGQQRAGQNSSRASRRSRTCWLADRARGLTGGCVE